jgi:photosystem II stability/assembly factor-like uncharacterized protein
MLRHSKGRIIYEDSVQLEFRSIARTDNYTYVLTAGNPALIYRISSVDDSVALVYTEVGEQVFYDSMQFWNDQEGIAMGDPQDGCFSVLKTTDAGMTWDKVDCSNLPKIEDGEAAYAASNSNIAIYKDHVWIVSGGMASRVYHSDDRGDSWQVFETPITYGSEMTGIYAVDFYNDKLGVIIGGDWNDKQNATANKAITYDGGTSWELLSDGDGPGYCSDIQFVPGTDGKELIAVGTPGIWWSGNRGKEWKQLTDQGFYTVEMLNDHEGLLAGNNIISKFTLLRDDF